MTETLTTIVALVPALIFAIVFHEVSHGYVAKLLGDPTAEERRRLSLNPLRHVDPVGTLFVPGALALLGGPIFGWAKPVPVDARRLRNPRFGMMAVAAAGPGSNLLLAGVGAVVLGVLLGSLAPTSAELAGMLDSLQHGYFPTISGLFSFAIVALAFFITINTFLALFNLLPIPPFDGSHIVEGLLPRSMAGAWMKMRQYGMLFFILLVAVSWAFPNSGIIEHVIWPPVEWALGKYYHLAGWVANG